MTPRGLVDYLEASAARHGRQIALVDSRGQSLTYAHLNANADALASHLIRRGVERGDRVGIVARKGIPAVTALYATMKAGAVCVPVDASAPLERRRKILTDCGVRALFADRTCLDVVPDLESGGPLAAVIVTDTTGPHDAVPGATAFQEAAGETATVHWPEPSELAYILYTSGSTGMPKGVTLTHDNMVSFVEWASRTLAPTEADRFSSHAPLHFDLSVLDLFLSAKHGATTFLISEDLGKSPKDLARFIAANRLTIWYSTPSALTLLLNFGRLESHDASSLRLVLFAGEVFPVRHLRALQQLWPNPAFYNLYGPTETNVCTFARIPARIPDDRDQPYPIGFVCDHCDSLVLDGEGREVGAGEEGLLYISGSSLFPGYWNRPPDAALFIERDGRRWYNTGDVVRFDAADGFIYLGRRDRMVKRRGYRIELGEIERAMYAHARLRDVAVVAVPDADAGVRIVAFVSAGEGEAPSVIALKTFCGTQLPAYMSPDQFFVRQTLPKTSTDKTDYQALRAEVLTSGAA
jgi:amino acid adenylation domain-containing protein